MESCSFFWNVIIDIQYFCFSSAPFRPADTENIVRFDAYGDSLGRYNIFHYHKQDDKYVYRKVCSSSSRSAEPRLTRCVCLGMGKKEEE